MSPDKKEQTIREEANNPYDVIENSIQPRVYLPETRHIEAANPDKRFAFVGKDDVSFYKVQGWKVYEDLKKEVKSVDGQTSLDTTIQTHDLIYMVIGGQAKDKWIRKKTDIIEGQRKEQVERLHGMENQSFTGKIDIR